MLTRLFAAVVLLSALAQSQPQQSSSAVASQAITANNSAADEFRISPYPQLEIEVPNALANEPANSDVERQKQSTELFDEQGNPVDPATIWHAATDRFCFSIASYIMLRDNAHSDATHVHGYTTCVPAARFRIYTTDEKR